MEEQRRSLRYTCKRPIDCRPLSVAAEPTWSATIQDISLGGLGLLLPRRFERGVLLAVHTVDGIGHGFIRLVQVKHIRSEGPQGCFLGCAFVPELSADELRALR